MGRVDDKFRMFGKDRNLGFATGHKWAFISCNNKFFNMPRARQFYQHGIDFLTSPSKDIG